MSGRQSAEVRRALKLVAAGWTPYKAAKHCGVSASTVYRARKSQAEPLERFGTSCPTDSQAGDEAGPAAPQGHGERKDSDTVAKPTTDT